MKSFRSFLYETMQNDRRFANATKKSQTVAKQATTTFGPEHKQMFGDWLDHSTRVNDSLWNKLPKSADPKERSTQAVELKHWGRPFRNLFNKSPTLSKDHVVYHGWTAPHEPTEGPMKIKGLIPTSFNQTTAHSFAHNASDFHSRPAHVLRIKMKKGTKAGAYISNFVNNSDFGHQHEFVLKSGNTLHIKGKPKTMKNNTKVWHAELKAD